MTPVPEKDNGEERLWKRFKKEEIPRAPSPCPDANDLAAYLDGRAAKKQSRKIEEHLVFCPECLRAVRELRTLLREPLPEVAEEVREKAKSLVDERPTAKRGPFFPLPDRLDLLFSWARSAAGWALAAAGIVAACLAGMRLGQNTFENRWTIFSRTPQVFLGFEGPEVNRDQTQEAGRWDHEK